MLEWKGHVVSRIVVSQEPGNMEQGARIRCWKMSGAGREGVNIREELRRMP